MTVRASLTRNLAHTARTALPAALLLGALAAGCGPSYEDQRPPVDQLDSRDRGLQSKDVLEASDALANDLLALPELNASREQWTVVFDRVEDMTTGNQFQSNFNIFLQRLQTNLARQGRGRIAVIENRDRFYDVRSRELEGERDDGRGGRGAAPAPGSTNPDFALYAKAMDLPGRGTVYYNLQFNLVDLHSRLVIWTNDYEVRVRR